jgi:methionyl-tRNA formyltransferase
MRLIFMGTPQFAVPTLKSLFASRHEIIAVVTQPDRPFGRRGKLTAPPVKQVGQGHSVPIFQPEKLNAEALPIDRLKPDALIVVAYGKILPFWLFSTPKHGGINLHASLLPRYRGAAPINWAIANGETVTGVTSMMINAGLDTGDILLQQTVAIGPTDTASDVHDQLATLGAELMLATLDLLERGDVTRTPQDARLATYAPILKKTDGELDWSKTATQVYNTVRAFNPWPGTYTYLEGTMLRIWKAVPVETWVSHEFPGRLVHAGSSGALVTCRLGSLELQEVQLENHKRMSALDFVNGIRLSHDQSLPLGR